MEETRSGGAVESTKSGVRVAVAPSRGRASAVEAPSPAREAELAGALYERYSGQIYGFCLHRLGSREEAEDAVQTTFLNAFRGISRGVEPQAESAWLFKIAENVCLSRHRSSFRRRRVEAPSDLEALQDVLPGHEPDKDELHGLERVLEGMPQTQRRAILLREWQGLSYREIADEMGITQAAVETLIFRARRSLAQGLEAAEREPRRRRARRSIDAGSLAAGLKTFLGSVGAVKTVAAVAVVTSATVVAVTPTPRLLHHTSRPSVRPHKRHVARVQRVVAPRAVTPVAAAPVASAPAVVRVAHVAMRHHRPPVPAVRHAVVKHVPAAPRAVVPAVPRAPAPAPVAPPPAAPVAAAPPPSPASSPAPQPVAPAPGAAPPQRQPEPSGSDSGGTQGGHKHHVGKGPSASPPSAGGGKGSGKGKKDKQHDRVPPPVTDRVPTNIVPPAGDGSSGAGGATSVEGGVTSEGSDGGSAVGVSGSGSDAGAGGSGSSGSGSGSGSGAGSGSNQPTSGTDGQRLSGTGTSSGSRRLGSLGTADA
jgi:RNA polymerase sigma factor (sigma-70 family)